MTRRPKPSVSAPSPMPQQTAASTPSQDSNLAAVPGAKEGKPTLEDIAQRPMNYTTMFELLNKNPEKEMEQERKRARRRAIFSAIGDGVSALANLYYTSKGALNVSPKQTMSAVNNDAWAAREKDLKDRIDKYKTGMQNAMKLDEETRRYVERMREQRAYKDRELQLKENKDIREKADAVLKARKADLQAQLLEGKLTQQEYVNGIKKAELEHADEYQRSRIVRNYNPGRSNSRSKNSYGTFDGVAYKTKADYEKAVEAAANEYNVPTKEEVKKTSGDAYDQKTTTETKRRSTSAVAAETEKAIKEKKHTDSPLKGDDNNKKVESDW